MTKLARTVFVTTGEPVSSAMNEERPREVYKHDRQVMVTCVEVKASSCHTVDVLQVHSNH